MQQSVSQSSSRNISRITGSSTDHYFEITSATYQRVVWNQFIFQRMQHWATTDVLVINTALDTLVSGKHHWIKEQNLERKCKFGGISMVNFIDLLAHLKRYFWLTHRQNPGFSRLIVKN